MKINRVELWDAMEKWQEHDHKTLNWGMMLMKYLCITSWVDKNTHIEMPEDAVRRLRLLHGPHARTVIKAWYAKHY